MHRDHRAVAVRVALKPRPLSWSLHTPPAACAVKRGGAVTEVLGHIHDSAYMGRGGKYKAQGASQSVTHHRLMWVPVLRRGHTHRRYARNARTRSQKMLQRRVQRISLPPQTLRTQTQAARTHNRWIKQDVIQLPYLRVAIATTRVQRAALQIATAPLHSQSHAVMASAAPLLSVQHPVGPFARVRPP